MAKFKYELPVLDRGTRFSIWQLNMIDRMGQCFQNDTNHSKGYNIKD